MTMEKQAFEDVSSIKHGDVPLPSYFTAFSHSSDWRGTWQHFSRSKLVIVRTWWEEGYIVRAPCLFFFSSFHPSTRMIPDSLMMTCNNCSYCSSYGHTVDGRNPAPVDMVNIIYPIIYDGFYTYPRWFSRRISEPSTVPPLPPPNSFWDTSPLRSVEIWGNYQKVSNQDKLSRSKAWYRAVSSPFKKVVL